MSWLRRRRTERSNPAPGEAGESRREHGATLVEYVLFVSLFVLVAIGAVGAMNSGARSYFASSSSQIGRPVNHDRDAGTPSTTYSGGGGQNPGGTNPTTSTTAVRPTTTTTPPTTTAAPTTTRATTTTTPPTTTTTTTIPRKVSVTLTATNTNSSGTRRSTFNVQLTAAGGASINGVTVRVSLFYGSANQGYAECTTNSSGACSWGPYRITNNPATWRVTDVDSSFWDGATPQTSAR